MRYCIIFCAQVNRIEVSAKAMTRNGQCLSDIQVKHHINPRVELDRDYVEESKNSDHWPAVTETREKILVDGFHWLAVSIAKNLNSSVMTRVINLDYGSVCELAELPKNKQKKAYKG